MRDIDWWLCVAGVEKPRRKKKGLCESEMGPFSKEWGKYERGRDAPMLSCILIRGHDPFFSQIRKTPTVTTYVYTYYCIRIKTPATIHSFISVIFSPASQFHFTCTRTWHDGCDADLATVESGARVKMWRCDSAHAHAHAQRSHAQRSRSRQSTWSRRSQRKSRRARARSRAYVSVIHRPHPERACRSPRPSLFPSVR